MLANNRYSAPGISTRLRRALSSIPTFTLPANELINVTKQLCYISSCHTVVAKNKMLEIH